VTGASSAHLNFQGPEPAVSANTAQMARHSIYCYYLPNG